MSRNEVTGLLGLHRVCDECITNGVWISPLTSSNNQEEEEPEAVSDDDSEEHSHNDDARSLRYVQPAIKRMDASVREKAEGGLNITPKVCTELGRWM